MKEAVGVKSHAKLDLREAVCPFSLVQTKLKLDELKPGQVLEVLLRGAAVENVPRAIEQEGHSVVHYYEENDHFVFFLQKGTEECAPACAQKDCLYCRDTLREQALERKKAGAQASRKSIEELQEQSKKLENASAEDVLRWALGFFGDRVALATSFGAEDMVLTDMIVKINPKARIFTLDTGRLHQETYDVMEHAMKRYGIRIETFSPDNRELEELTRMYGPNLFYESIENRISCCQVRKINPLKRALATIDAWVCGLRKEQSPTRTEIRKIELGAENGLMVKICPLADWKENEVWDYVRKNDIPYNKLHDRGFPSIGCAPCTRAIGEGEDLRAGRWWWELPDKKECGLHKRVK